MASDYEKAEARKMGMDYIWAGAVGQLLGVFMLLSVDHQSSPGPILEAAAVTALGTAVLAGGFARYARYYGRSQWWSLMSFFSVLGMLVLAPKVGSKKMSEAGGFEVLYAPAYQRDVWRMDVRIRVDESLGAGVWEPIQMQLPRGSSVLSAAKTLAGAVPELGQAIDQATFLVNGQPAKPSDDLSNGDELIISGTGESAPAEPPQQA